jgi:prepilin-type N-terminal cleavage/methylation domain-containing protein
MTKRRGFTLAEVMITSVLASLIVGATGGLMVFASKRAQHAYSENAVTTQVLQLSAEMEATISKAVVCTAQTNLNGSSLKCIMPATGKDGDRDSLNDDWEAVKISSAGTEKYGAGLRIWYYWGDNSGSYSVASAKPIYYRAYRNDDAMPTGADMDPRFSRLYAASGSRWNLVDNVTFSVSPATGVVTYVITASKLISQERKESTSSSDTREYRLSRSVMCQEWRK